jgi:hypothetical protein
MKNNFNRILFALALIISGMATTAMPAIASTCSFDQMVSKDAPAVWYTFDGIGVPVNQGSTQTTTRLEGNEPSYSEKTRCGNAYAFKAFGGKYSFQGLPQGTLSDGDFTIETIARIPRQNVVTYPTIFNIFNPGWATLRIRTSDSNAGKVEYAYFNPNEQGFYSPGVVDDNQFHHLVLVHKAGRVRFFIDGVLNYERAINGPFNYDDSLFYVGGSGSAIEAFPGSIDHFALYPNSLSDAVVALHFSAYLQDFYSSTPASPSTNGQNAQVAAPSAAPGGFNLISFAGGVTASWSVPEGDTNTVKVDINCSVSGTKSTTVASRQLEASFQGLQAGEVCSGQIFAQNGGGTSPPSPRIANVTVRGISPITPAVSVASLSGSDLLVTVSNVDVNASEILVELTCSKSGTKSLTTSAKIPNVNFGAITTGDSCYANATARNLWGSAPRGANSNPVGLNGEKPQSINFSTQSTIPGELKVTWSAQSTTDVTVSASLVCRDSNKATQEVGISQLQINFSNLSPGDSCSLTLFAKNTWGSSATTTKESIAVMGKPPVGEPVVKMARAKMTAMALAWESNPSATYMNIRVFCTNSGNKTINIDLPATETEIPGQEGDSCYTILRWANPWGYASETINTPLLKLTAKAPVPVVSSKKILCVKGKNSLTIVGKNPICPSGYKKKASS